MKKIIIIVLIAFTSCKKETSYSSRCGKVLNKIHEKPLLRNEIWALSVSASDSTEYFIGIDSVTFEKINIGDRYCW